MRRLPLALVALLVALPAAGAGAARADNPVLTGDVGAGDSFTINLADSTGTRVKNLDPGTYTLVLHDHSSVHNFDLTGPGVSVSTDVDAIEDKTFTITLSPGTYTYVCDAHVATMKGTFTVGAPTTTPPAPTPAPTPKPAATKLLAFVGPGAKISLRSTDGSALSSLPAGAFTIVVSDRSAKDNFHLTGPGISKATGVAFKGTATWKVSLKAGKYVFKSDKHAALHGGFALSG